MHLLEVGDRDATHHLMVFLGQPGSGNATMSGDSVSDQSSKPEEVMTGKRKARKEEVLPCGHAGSVQHIF